MFQAFLTMLSRGLSRAWLLLTNVADFSYLLKGTGDFQEVNAASGDNQEVYKAGSSNPPVDRCTVLTLSWSMLAPHNIDK